LLTIAPALDGQFEKLTREKSVIIAAKSPACSSPETIPQPSKNRSDEMKTSIIGGTVARTATVAKTN